MLEATTPLEQIERSVQSRATSLSLDVDSDDGRARLREMIDETVLEWTAQHQRGQRQIALSDPEGVADRAFRNLARYGPLTELLDDDDVWEIMVNAPDSIFVRRHSGGSRFHDEVFHDDEHVTRTITKLLDDSGTSHRKLDPKEGLQDAQLDSGARIHLVHGDLSRGGHLLLNIRKFSGVSITRLDELVRRGSLTTNAAEFLSAAVRSRMSIIFAGAPGAGKTTLLSCCAAELDPSLRVVVAEEVFEADVPILNVASMQTRPARSDRSEVDLRRLVAGFLRMAPDVAIVGEVRDREALPLLLTLSSGVTGYTTIHSGSAHSALTRLKFLAQLGDRQDIPVAALNSMVSESVDLVVHTERTSSGPQVSSILAVEDLTSGPDAVNFTTTELFSRDREHASLEPTGLIPLRATKKMARFGFDTRTLLGEKVT
ncbi:MAG: ATPase, T2SS/T4P/T4SS family [Microthrixaceae bacterium]